jgi:hypothetical protein
MITYYIYYRFQLKEPVLLRLKGLTFLLKFITDVVCYGIMITLAYF